ncbi:uncharacterized protein N7483_002449 [Penicillium malachiteum]|uniref:uncharacterized protein n=1 Tax=Penicillium malachiteum TaxID=1324776 RepID=UPI002547E8D8|nr:uncharacterized protein N7483_002449 [Penicillium malachiteum]KAJ5737324.1 hypothetical protein N7483_002449 [Penicillium malachiteum]
MEPISNPDLAAEVEHDAIFTTEYKLEQIHRSKIITQKPQAKGKGRREECKKEDWECGPGEKEERRSYLTKY